MNLSEFTPCYTLTFICHEISFGYFELTSNWMREGEGERKFPNLSNVENTSDLIISGVYVFKNIIKSFYNIAYSNYPKIETQAD